MGVRSPRKLTSDTTLLFEGFNPAHAGQFDHPIIGVSPGFYAHSLSKNDVDRYVLAHAKAVDEAVEKFGFHVVFLPHYVSGLGYDDLEVSRLILDRMKNKERARILDTGSVEAFKATLDCMDIVISSKMHPAVLAVSGFVPTLCIAYDQKQSGFFQRLGLMDCVISIREFSSEKLFSKIARIWGNRNQIRATLKERVPLLQKETREAIAFAVTPALGIPM